MSSRANSGELESESGFSLVTGGPLYRLYVRTRLAGPALEPMRRLIAGAALLCWLPSLLLSLSEGRFDSGAEIPFLFDVEAHIRFLVAVPLLLGAETMVHRLLRPVAWQFVERGIVSEADRGRLEELIESATRLRNSVAIELLLLLSVGLGYWLSERNIHGVSTWYSDPAGRLTAAGYWNALISLPIVRFLILRWYFRISVWYGFLLSVRALPLHLNLFHPDRAGGLGFLADSVTAFAPVLIAQSAIVSATIANRILHAGMTLPDFNVQILGVIIFLMLTVLTPLCFFINPLTAARWTAIRDFGTLASRYVEEFRRKWLQSETGTSEPLLGSPDLQSLADIGSAYEMVNGTRALPFTNRTIARLAIALALPMAPLTLTMIPLRKMIDGAIKLLL